MSQALKITVSGLRGIVGQGLTAEVALNYGSAFGAFLNSCSSTTQPLKVCVGKDSRPSGAMLGAAVTAGLCQVGVDVLDLGVVTTPGVAVMVGELSCAGGVVVTASHNGPEYNGIKLLMEDCAAPPGEVAEQIKQGFLRKDFEPAGSQSCGTVGCTDRTDEVHIARVLGIVDRQKIAGRSFRVVLDSVNGAGGRVAGKLLGELGCRVTAVNAEPTGDFAHPPEPTAENLTQLCRQVAATSADVGFAQDPDGDRLAIVDENGTYVGEEYTLVLAAKNIFSKRAGAAATNLSTSRMIDDVAEACGCRVIRTAVGEANVARAMLRHNCTIGGEGNGGVIDLRVSPVRDSLVAMALVLELMADSGRPISQLVAEVPRYYMEKAKFPADEQQANRFLQVATEKFSTARLDTTDGCRFDFEDGWLHIRASNTEPVVRVIVEARDKQTVEKYLHTVGEIRKGLDG